MTGRKYSLLRQFLWAATLTVGFGTLWFLLVLWCDVALQNAWPGGKRNRPPYEDLVVRSDGAPLVRSIPVGNPALMTFRDLSGRVQATPERDDLLPAINLSGVSARPGFFSPTLSWNERLKVFMNEREPTESWYFVHDDRLNGSGYFVGYERTGNRRIGFVGLSGFRSQPLPPGEWIPVRGELIRDYSNWSSAPLWASSGRVNVGRLDRDDLPPRLVYVPSGNRLQRVDLAERTVTFVFEIAEPIESLGIPPLSSWSGGRAAKEQPILVRTKDRIHALDHNFRVVKVFTIPAEVDRQSPARWYDLAGGESLVVFTGPYSVYRIAADATIRDHFNVTLQTGTQPQSEPRGAYILALALPAPLILFVTDLVLAGDLRMPNDRAAFLARLGSTAPSFFIVLVVSSVLAIVAWRLARSYGLSKQEQVTWTAFVLLFGPAGYLGLSLHRRWPIRQPCPHCHEPAPRDRPDCAKCNARFPGPALLGIEIFA